MTVGVWSWPFVAALSVAVASCGKSPTPPTAPTSAVVATSTTPSAVPEARFSLTVDTLGSQHAITGLSEVNIDATASTGSGLRYAVDLGDGTTASEATTRHVYGTAGTFRITVTVTDSANQAATTSRELIVTSPLGAWLYSGYLSSSHFVEVRTVLLTEQHGTTVRGVVSRAGHRDLDITGTLTADRRIRIAVQGLSETLEGAIPSVFNGNQVTWPLVARGGPANGETLTFSRREGVPTGPPPLASLKLRFLSFDAPFAIRGLTPIEFDASDSRGEGLKYFIEFGDREISTSPTTIHTVADDGSSRPTLCWNGPNFKARLTVVDRFGRSDVDTDSYLVKTLTDGDIYNSWLGGYAEEVTIETQRGSNIAGTFEYRTDHRSFTGVVRLDGDIRLTLDSGEQLVGSITLGREQERLVLKWLGGPNHGTTLQFGHRCNY